MASVTITVPLNSSQLEQIMGILSKASTSITPMTDRLGSLLEANREEPIKVTFDRTSAQQLRELLRGQTERLVKFVLVRGTEFFNDELAQELGFDNPAYTSSVLGKITGKLRKVGVRAEGHRHMNWYTTHKENGRTLLRIRPDVFQLFRDAFSEGE